MRFQRPTNVHRIDADLDRLGIKRRVIDVLRSGWNIKDIRDVICWVQLDGPEAKPVVVAHFMKIEGTANSKQSRTLSEAIFDASGKGSFGPVGSKPLTDEQTAGVRKLATRTTS